MTVVKRLPAADPHLPMMMGMVFAHVRARLAADAPELRPSQLRVLEWLPADGLTISELAECADMTTQGCGQFVRQLAGLGMVEVAVADHDARARRVRITDRGHEALARAGRVLEQFEQACAAQVGAERWRVFREVLEDISLAESAVGEQSGSARGSVRPSG